MLMQKNGKTEWEKWSKTMEWKKKRYSNYAKQKRAENNTPHICMDYSQIKKAIAELQNDLRKIIYK